MGNNREISEIDKSEEIELIKVFDFSREDKTAYLIKSMLSIINIHSNVRIYIHKIKPINSQREERK